MTVTSRVRGFHLVSITPFMCSTLATTLRVNGQFLSMDLAVNDFSKCEEVTQWVRVQTSDPAHIKLVQYFTKGKILTIHGNIKIDQWEGKDGTPRVQLRVHAKNIDFLNIGKKPVTDNNVPDAPTDTPKEKKDDLPF